MKTAYKLLKQRKDGTLGPLFINTSMRVTLNEWHKAEAHRTKGFAFRPGWHCCAEKKAPHLSKKGRVWCEVMIDNYEEFKRPEIQGGLWYLAKQMKIIKVLG